ncbi:class I SAM-dependent methyltransferase [Patescibacteria group bacterium]|nr:MAG: class I SAM-dependent methyltransferase [Patescibacteria group bacterium]
MIAYDPPNKRLALFQREATPDFWDEQWQKENIHTLVASGKTHHFIKRFTKRYVSTGGKILEGGCGSGQVVWCLNQWGYDSYGIDYADKTLQAVTDILPDLQLSVQDVRQTTFPNNFFDAYWSLGVIEHFWEGFDEITQEAHRVLKPGGILFLSFPVMSPLRKLKARLGLYQPMQASASRETFYEFMLDQKLVTQQLAEQGFALVETYLYDALKGLKDELPLLHIPLQKLYKSKLFVTRGLRFSLTFLVGRWTGHMALLVFRKNS